MQLNLKPDNDTAKCIWYLRGDDPVVSKALRYIVAMLGKSVGYVHCPGLALMRGVETLREGTKERQRQREGGRVAEKLKILVWKKILLHSKDHL